MRFPRIALPLDKVDGKVTTDRPRFARLLEQLPDGHYEVLVQRWDGRRSAKQNRAYWSCIVAPISAHTGYTPDETHEILRYFCNPKIVGITNKETGEVEDVQIGGSTAALTVEAFHDYFERCQQFAAEKLDCYCPSPNEEYAFNR